MNELSALDKQFRSHTILTAEELMLLVNKINDIIAVVLSIKQELEEQGDPENPEDLDSKINNAVNDAIQLLRDLMDESLEDMDRRILDLMNKPNGPGNIHTDSEWAEWLKQTLTNEEDGTSIINAVLMEMGLLNEDGDPYWDANVVQLVIDAAGTVTQYASSIEILKNKISLLVTEKLNGEYVVNPAGIILAIENDLSIVGLVADKIVLDGTTYAEQIVAKGLTASKLTAVLAEVSNLNVTGTFKTGTEGYIAQMNADNDSGVFKIYNSNTNKNTVLIKGYSPSTANGYTTGAYMEFSSPDYNTEEKTGWCITFGAHGVAIFSYINKECSTIMLTPDIGGTRTDSTTALKGGMIVQTESLDGSNVLRRKYFDSVNGVYGG